MGRVSECIIPNYNSYYLVFLEATEHGVRDTVEGTQRKGLPSFSLYLLHLAPGKGKSPGGHRKRKIGRNPLFKILIHNSYTVQFTHLKCTTQWFLVC